MIQRRCMNACQRIPFINYIEEYSHAVYRYSTFTKLFFQFSCYSEQTILEITITQIYNTCLDACGCPSLYQQSNSSVSWPWKGTIGVFKLLMFAWALNFLPLWAYIKHCNHFACFRNKRFINRSIHYERNKLCATKIISCIFLCRLQSLCIIPVYDAILIELKYYIFNDAWSRNLYGPVCGLIRSYNSVTNCVILSEHDHGYGHLLSWQLKTPQSVYVSQKL